MNGDARSPAPPARPRTATAVAASLALAVGLAAAPVAAQPEWRVPPLLDGRLLVGGDVSATMGSRDRGFYNHTDYDISLLRYVSVQFDAEWRLGDRASIVGQIRSENDHGVHASAWFVRLRPMARVPLTFEAGRLPHVFGQATNRRYGSDNPLIGLPLGYQYLTSLRADSVALSADALLRSRGRGWLLSYPQGLGSPDDAAGVPIVAALRWDTGVKATWDAGGIVEASLALTVGSLSQPRVDDDNGGRQVAARVVARPAAALAIGMSAARGAYLADVARTAIAGYTGSARRDWYQSAVGADVEWSLGHWLARAEVLTSRWRTPRLARPLLPDHLDATSGMVEARYRVHPRAWLAGRAEHLWFSRITGTVFGGEATTWDAPVTRVEAGIGLLLTRQLVLKSSYQHAWRDAGRVRSPHLGAAQLSFWF